MKIQANPIHQEYLHTLAKIREFYAKYSIDLARRQAGTYDEKIEVIEVHLNEVAESITYAISREMLENEYFNNETKEEEK